MPKFPPLLWPLGMALLLPQCGPGPRPPATTTAPLRIAIDEWAGYYPLVLAEDLGYLHDEGTAVVLSIPKNTDRMLAQFAARDYDAVCVCVADAVTVTRAVPDLRIVLLSDESSGGDQILARSIPATPDALRHKRIGTNLGGFGELLVRRYLQSQGVPVADIDLVNVDAANVPQQLALGAIDLGHTWEPYATAAREAGMTPLFTSAATPGLVVDGMICRSETARERRGELRGLARAWFRAVAWWRTHPEEGDRRIERRLGLPPGQARPNGIRVLELADNHELLRGGAQSRLVASLQEYVDFFTARGLLLQRPDPRRMACPDLLP